MAENTAVALALGWTMAELYDHPFVVHHDPPDPDQRLPGLSHLSVAQRSVMRLDQIDAALSTLAPTLQAAGQTLPSTTRVRARFTAEHADVEEARKAINALHFEIIAAVSAAGISLGKAYGLGRALADTCQPPADAEALGERFGHFRLENLRAWLNDLATTLPDHSAKAVLVSISRWEAWAANARSVGAVDFERAASSVKAILRRQGEMWRTVLCGEKGARDGLTPEDYVQAGKAVARRAIRLACAALARYLWALVIVLVVVALVIVLVLTSPTSQLVTGIGAALAAFGITWKGVGSVTEKLSLALGRPLWGSELDAAVSNAITFLPLEPTAEPAPDVLWRSPQYLRALVAAQPTPGAPVSAAQLSAALRRGPGRAKHRLGAVDFLTVRPGGFWRAPAESEVSYWLAWASAAGYLTRLANPERYELTAEGSRLAKIPARAPGAVRAAISAARPNTVVS